MFSFPCLYQSFLVKCQRKEEPHEAGRGGRDYHIEGGSIEGKL